MPARFRFACLAATLSAGCPLAAFSPIGSTWGNGDIVMHLQLGQPASPLSDGATDWNQVAKSALEEWNTHLVRSRFTAVPDSTAAVDRGNRINNVAFRPDIYGSAFGDRTLAVTLGTSNATTGRSLEQDVLFNSNLTWNSYRGPLRPGIREFRRVALHEFGHVLGLDHPDQAQPPQAVAAIMNSLIGLTETLQSDDVVGARVLYDPNSGSQPALAAHPQSSTLRIGDPYTMAVTVGGSGAYHYAWTFRAAGSSTAEPFRLASGPSYTIGSVQAEDAGIYSVTVTNALSGASVTSNTAQLSVTPVATSSDTLLANISTRGVVGSGPDVLIAGLVVGGTSAKDVLIRAVGPGLADFGVAGTLANPLLRILDQSGRVVAENDDWGASQASAIAAASTRVGGFQFKPGSQDAAVLTRLTPGSYTAVVSGVAGTTGVALVEAYDADADVSTARSRKLVNIATRGRVGSGDNALIAGLVVTGPGPRTYLIRAVGPTLTRAPFHVPGALQDPFLQIFRGDTLLRENDDWDAPSASQAALRETARRVGAFPLGEVRSPGAGLDAAMLITLQPGSYTAKVSGYQSSSGVALIEIYEVP